MANGQMAMPRWRRWLPYSIPIRNRTPRREPATSLDPSQDATCVVPPYTGRETVDSPRRPVPLPKRSRSGSATIRSVPPRMKYPDGTHCDRPRLGAVGSTSSVFGARDRGLAPDTVRHQEPAHECGMWTPPWLASLTSYRSRWQSGQVRSYVRPLGAAHFWPRARMVFVRSDPNRNGGLGGPS